MRLRRGGCTFIVPSVYPFLATALQLLVCVVISTLGKDFFNKRLVCVDNFYRVISL